MSLAAERRSSSPAGSKAPPPQRAQTHSRPGSDSEALSTGAASRDQLWSRVAPRADYFSTGGQSLGSLREPMESSFGTDFSAVRLHRDSRADALNARAATQGEDIHLARGEEPDGPGGRQLIAHELAHVVQQRAARTRPSSGVIKDRASEARADIAAKAAVEGRAVPHPGVVPLAAAGFQCQPKPPAPPPGGNILYIGMNNYAPEVNALKALYAGRPVTLTTVTVTEEESKTKTSATGTKAFDLTADAGVDSFAGSLGLVPARATQVGDLLKAQGSLQDRDDMAHVIAVYAATDADGKDRMTRVVLSGHSYGTKVYNEDAKGEIYFDFLVKLAAIFPTAAGQTKHLMIAACMAGGEANIINVYQKAYPNLVTFAGWTSMCPTGAGAASALTEWAKTTDKDPTSMSKPDAGRSNWASGTYQGDSSADATTTMANLRADQSTFDDYFSGKKVDPSAHSGWLTTYYGKARSAALRATDILGADHDYAQTHADQGLRLRYWSAQVSNFWKTYSAAIQKGYGSATAPDFSKMSRKDALQAIADFAKVAGGSAPDITAARALLDALQNLDPGILKDTWLAP